LYRDKFKFAVTPDGAAVGAPELPEGKIKTDEFFGKVETYRGTVVVKLPLSGAAAGQTVVLAADSQGCADVGVCYPPTRQKLTLALPARGAGPGAVVDATPPKKSWFK
jgi:thiol:disulfide interchange protein DsbD